MICKKCGTEFEPSKGLKSYCSLTCRNSRSWSVEDKQKKRDAVLNNPELLEKCKLAGMGTVSSDIVTTCKHCSKPIHCKSYAPKKYHAECWRKCCGGYQKNSTIKHRSIYKGYQMDSGSEREFATLLDKHNIKWVKNTTEFFHYADVKGKKRKYYPDFYLPDYKQWVEIKGKFYENENDVLKLESVGNIELIYSDDIRLPCFI